MRFSQALRTREIRREEKTSKLQQKLIVFSFSSLLFALLACFFYIFMIFMLKLGEFLSSLEWTAWFFKQTLFNVLFAYFPRFLFVLLVCSLQKVVSLPKNGSIKISEIVFFKYFYISRYLLYIFIYFSLFFRSLFLSSQLLLLCNFKKTLWTS